MSKEEKEIKMELLIPLGEFLARANKLGFVEKGEIVQVDSYYDLSDWRLYKSVAALRIREVNGIYHSYAFKKVFHTPNRVNPHYVEEIEGTFPVSDPSHLKAIFSRLQIDHNGDGIVDGKSLSKVFNENGFTCEQVMRKTRRIFIDEHGNELTLDDVDGVGQIIELECKTDDPLKLVSKLLTGNEWRRNIIGTSYLWLEQIKGFDIHNQFSNMFDKKPDWNVWDNERELYDKLTRLV